MTEDFRYHSFFNGIKGEIVEKFFEFHEANPHIYELFEYYTEQLKKKGRLHYGAKATMERIRWHIEIETGEAEDFKINNNHTSCYTRLLSIRRPWLMGFYETRRTPGAAVPEYRYEKTGQGVLI